MKNIEAAMRVLMALRFTQCRNCLFDLSTIVRSVVGAIVLIPIAVQAETLSLTSSADTALFENSPDNNLGGEPDFPSGTIRTGQRSRGLIRFDLAGHIPANAAITSATLTVKVVRTPSGAVSSIFGVHRVLKAWVEGNKTGNGGQSATSNETTWNNRMSPATAWSVPGATSPTDYSSTESATRLIAGSGSYTFVSTSETVADVQFWLNNTQSNFGWILIGQSEGTPSTAKRFGSREDSNNVPTLEIEFTVPPTDVQISGTLNYFSGSNPVPGVTVALSGDKTETVITQTDGRYSFTVNSGGNYSITPTKPIEYGVRQGISTFDIALQRRHILGIVALDSPYKVIAADVNNSSSVTTLDGALIRRMVLALADTFPAGLWTFVRSDFEFSDSSNPWPFDQVRNYSNLTQDMAEQDFIGIKHGDVAGKWTPPSFTVASRGDLLEISNGLTGVRIPSPDSFNPLNPYVALAPIQSVLLRDGSWTDSSDNYLKVKKSFPTDPAVEMTSIDVEFLRSSEDEVILKITYHINRPPFMYGGKELQGRGPGYYSSTLKIVRGEPVIMILEEGNQEVEYALGIMNGLNATVAQYRGHHATSPEYGEHPDGGVYGGFDTRDRTDAIVELNFDERTEYRHLAVWDPWIYDSGWYWQFYDGEASDDSNLFGIFAGQASKALGINNATGVRLFTDTQSMSDQAVACNGQQVCHSIIQQGDRITHLSVDASGVVGEMETLGSGFIEPSVSAIEDRVVVVAYDLVGGASGSGGYVVFDKDSNGGFRESVIDLGDGVQIIDSKPYVVSSDIADFFLLNGERNGQSGLLLYSRLKGQDSFVYRNMIEDYTMQPSTARRPNIVRLDDDRILLIYTVHGGQANYVTIPSGALDFEADFHRLGSIANSNGAANSGASIDPRTGDIFLQDGNDRSLYLFQAKGDVLAAEFSRTQALDGVNSQVYGQAPNRRTLASDDNGNALVFHSGWFLKFVNETHSWEEFEAADSLNISSSSVTFNSNTQEFQILGNYRGSVALFTYNFNQDSLELRYGGVEGENAIAGLEIELARRGSTTAVSQEVGYEWGIYVGTKGDSLRDPRDFQPIARVMNRHSGLGDGRLDDYQSSDYPDSPALEGGLFLPPDVMDRIIERVRTDDDYYLYLAGEASYDRDILNMWRDESGELKRQMIDEIEQLAQGMKNSLTVGDGIYDKNSTYWHAGLDMIRAGNRIALLLADDSITPPEKESLKGIVSLFGHILWDEDFVPLRDGTGLNLGTANMPVQQLGYRDFYALLLAEHPDFKERASNLADRTIQTLHHTINEFGANFSSPHYAGASFEPTLMKALQLKQSGVVDLFATDDRLRLVAEFYINFLTPPEIRFGEGRKLVSIGDGTTEGTEIPGLLAAGFADVDPQLSARLMGAWVQGGSVHSDFFGSTIIMINDELPVVDPALGNANFPGYHSVLRYGWGTENESALWFINGDFYSDHRHADHGSILFYALGAPISIDWGSFYSPYAPGAAMHSVVVPKPMIPWGSDENAEIDISWNRAWDKSEQKAVSFFENSASSTAQFHSGDTTWDRTVQGLSYEQDSPIFVIRDQIMNGEEEFIFNLNLMAEGTVQTPQGEVTPPVKRAQNGEGPSLGEVFELSAGVNQFQFTGQWGVDFDVYVIADESREVTIGNWGHNAIGGQNTEESQHILRIKGSNEFEVLILPRKSDDVNNRVVRREGAQVIVEEEGDVTIIHEHFTAYTDGSRHILSNYGGDPVSIWDLSISGGQGELEVGAASAKIMLHGDVGVRRVMLSGGWSPQGSPNSDVTFDSITGEWIVDYEGGDPLSVEFVATE